MARLSDIPRVLRRVGPIAFGRRVANQVFADNLLTWAAAMAYSWLFALFPFLIFLLSLLPLLPDQIRLQIADGVNSTIETQLPGPAGETVRETVGPLLGIGAMADEPARDMITTTTGQVLVGNIKESESDEEYLVIYDEVVGRERVPRAAIAEDGVRTAEQLEAERAAGVEGRQVNSWRGLLSLGVLLTLFAASGGMNMTMSALDQCYDIKRPRPFWLQRIIAIGLTLVVGSLVVVVLVLLPVTSVVLAFLGGDFFGDNWVVSFAIDLVRYAVALTLLVLILGIVYHVGPSLKRRFHLVTPGAVFTIVGWLLTGLALSTYVTSFGGAENYAKTYGAVVGIVVLLLLFYVDSLILMIGAELNSEIDFAVSGVARPTADPAEEPPAEMEDKDEEDHELAEQLREATAEDADPSADRPASLG